VTQLTDWITAVSTLLTAPVAVFSGLAAWYTYKGSIRNTSVLTEAKLKWRDATTLRATITLTNLDIEKIVVSSVEILSPKQGRLMEEQFKPSSVYTPRDEANVEPSQQPVKIICLNESIFPPGQEQRIGHSLLINSNCTQIRFYLSGLALKPGSLVKYRLRYSTSSLSVRNKALDARAIIPAAPKSSTDEIAKNTA